MRKLVFLLSLLFLSTAMVTAAESYTALWKQYYAEAEEWHPRTGMALLDKIITRATAEKEYGHLIKAQICRSSMMVQLSPDSFDIEVARMERAEAAATEPVLKAVYATVLGKLYRDDYQYANKDGYEAKYRACFARALQDKDRLAHTQARVYEPLVVRGGYASVFDDDLLHVIGFEAQAYAELRDYYAAHANRHAACIMAGWAVTNNYNKVGQSANRAKQLQQIDSLIAVYQDIEEAGDLAIRRFELMKGDSRFTEADRMTYIDNALAKWGAWKGMNRLRNERAELIAPTFTISLAQERMLPATARMVRINALRNIKQLTLNVYRLKDSYYKASKGYTVTEKPQALKRYVAGKPVQVIRRRYYGQPAYKTLTDTATIAPLPLGVYLVEAVTDTKGVEPQYAKLHVTDMMVLVQNETAHTTRLVAVSATTGQPVPGARIEILSGEDKVDVLTTDSKGEASIDLNNRSKVRACTTADSYAPYSPVWSHFANASRQGGDNVRLFTDRSIYRPGQTVQVALVAYKVADAVTTNVLADREYALQLKDANYKVVAEKKVTTDSYGTASASFVLPTTALTGTYRICVGNSWRESVAIAVEQYKRISFRIDMDTVKTRYEMGDTVAVTGRAISYAGMPVQGAKVKYGVQRRTPLWWRYGTSRADDTQVASGEVVTDASGAFTISVPMTVPDADEPHFVYNFAVNATVTDAAGETHAATTVLPLSSRATFLRCDMAQMAERDSLRNFRFVYTNIQGTEIAGTVSYTIDGHAYTAPANRLIDAQPIIAGLKSGRHSLQAICGTDTVRHSFVIFTLDDDQLPVDTLDWFYLSSRSFGDRGPIRLQLGSSAADQYVVYSLISGGRMIERGSFNLNGRPYRRDFTYRSEYGDGLTLAYAWVRHGRLYSHTVHLVRPMPDKRLVSHWTTFRDHLVPGQKETWTLHVSRPDGRVVSAQLMAALYDKSLDALHFHRWSFGPLYTPVFTYGVQWVTPPSWAKSLYAYLSPKQLSSDNMEPSRLAAWSYADGMPSIATRGKYRVSRVSAISSANRVYKSSRMASAAQSETAFVTGKVFSGVLMENTVTRSSDTGYTGEAALRAKAAVAQKDIDAANATAPNLRENFAETAFFYPSLETDAKGDVRISFTLPEAVTTWKFLAFAHDRDMNYGLTEAEAVAQKAVMVQPNMPRFVRMGDQATVSARIMSTDDVARQGTVRMDLLTADGSTVVYTQRQPFSVDAHATTSATFSFTPRATDELLICRIVAEGRNFSDGEQHYLPVLPDKEQVLNTLLFTLERAGKHTFSVASLFAPSATHCLTTIEYTDNPAWLAVQALPALAQTTADNAISIAAAYYANAIAYHLVTTTPAITTALKLWQQTPDKSLLSTLEANPDLKTILLEETPWLMQAANDTERMRSLARYLDANQLATTQEALLRKLTRLANANGAISWFAGMEGSRFVTLVVSEMLERINRLAGKQTATAAQLSRSYEWLDRQMDKYVAQLKSDARNSKHDPTLSESDYRYLYVSALAGHKVTPTIEYLLGLMQKPRRDLTIYGRAHSAVILALFGRGEQAANYLQSARESTVYKPGMGRYYDTPLAQLSWADYRIPTQVATIEALSLITPADTATIAEMQQWLLQEKRTTAWTTPINSVNAVYALLMANGQALTTSVSPAVIYADGKRLTTSRPTPLVGTATVRCEGTAKTITVQKTGSHTSWGAVYAQALVPVAEAGSAAAGLSVKRELIAPDGPLKVGTRVKVRITLQADRDYDFVQVIDRRAACLEPANQLSGYSRGYYYAPRDNSTAYFFEHLAKGSHVLETEYYVDRAGNYQTGTCEAQCAYSPAFTGRAAATSIRVNP